MNPIRSNAAQASVLVAALQQRSLAGFGFAVGIQGDVTARTPDAEGNGGEISNVEVAIVNEFGSEERGIPSRPFMRITFSKHRRQWVRAMVLALKQSVAGDQAKSERTIRTLGVQAVGQMQGVMNDRTNFAPNSERRIIEKKSDQPLRDTGQLWQSVRSSFETPDGEEAIG